ncbi:MAG: M48 family metallopeptidase, partial [Gammaproteobacteria bacterium]|nr:M48 family metallopeptidase [Gammaproteobacteria bacterium]
PICYNKNIKTGLIEESNELTIHYQTSEQAIKLLRNWLRNKAKQVLPPMLAQIASEFDFEFNKTSIRSQKSRWGSCSSSGTISLNDQLLFMPVETVRYLMIHELCHTQHMNHSYKFWNLVESCCMDYRQHDHILSKGREKVPGWFSRSLFC